MTRSFLLRMKRAGSFALGLCWPWCLLLGAGCTSTPPAPLPVVTAPVGREPLPVPDPVDFLQQALERYDRQGIEGYRLVMEKQERIDGKLQPPEEIKVSS